jgi:large subunit ribosomal protein L10
MEKTTPQAHVQQWKKDIVKTISDEVKKYDTVAIINLENLPSRQSQLIRSKIKDDVKIIVTRKRLIKLALKKAGKSELKQLAEHLKGMPALILTNKNAFELFKILKDNMSLAPAKTGQTAPEDIWVKAGPTPFAPGPIIGDLGAANIVAGIDGGKVVVKKDSLVVKEGEKIPAAAANILTRLDIKPMKVGLNLIVALEKGQIYDKKVLNIDMDEYITNLKTAIINAKKLALGANILTAETAAIKLQEAHLNAKKLAIGAEIMCDETKEYLIKKAEAQATALKEKVPNSDAVTSANKVSETSVQKESPAEIPADTTEPSSDTPSEKSEVKSQSSTSENTSEKSNDGQKGGQ